MTTKHTPTPWKVEPMDGAGLIFNPTIANGSHFAEALTVEDAAFIVRACNEYDTTQRVLANAESQIAMLTRNTSALVAALRDLIPTAEEEVQRISARDDARGEDASQNRLFAARAALKLAEGGRVMDHRYTPGALLCSDLTPEYALTLPRLRTDSAAAPFWHQAKLRGERCAVVNSRGEPQLIYAEDGVLIADFART